MRLQYTVEDYRRCAAEGLTKADTARKLGRSTANVTLMAQKHQIAFPEGRLGRPSGYAPVRAKRAPSAPEIPLWIAEKIVADVAALPDGARWKYRVLRVTHGVPHNDCMAVLA